MLKDRFVVVVVWYANCKISDIMKPAMVANNTPIEIFASRGFVTFTASSRSPSKLSGAPTSSLFEIWSLGLMSKCPKQEK